MYYSMCQAQPLAPECEHNLGHDKVTCTHDHQSTFFFLHSVTHLFFFPIYKYNFFTNNIVRNDVSVNILYVYIYVTVSREKIALIAVKVYYEMFVYIIAHFRGHTMAFSQ